jgi:hypothetical protein
LRKINLAGKFGGKIWRENLAGKNWREKIGGKKLAGKSLFLPPKKFSIPNCF